MSVALLQAYAQRIRELRRANAAVPEPALAPTFQQLLEGLIALLPVRQGLTVLPEYRNPGVGRPDIALVRQGAPPRAFVELKAPATSADPTRWRGHNQRQFERFRELPCWATCNFAEFRLFDRADQYGSAVVVPEHSLRPDRDDAVANRAIANHDSGPFLRLIERLCDAAGQEPSARDAEHLATLMAHSARLVRGIVRDRLAEDSCRRKPGSRACAGEARIPRGPLRPPGGGRLQHYRFQCPVLRRLCADARLRPAAGARRNRLPGGFGFLATHAARTPADADGAARIKPR